MVQNNWKVIQINEKIVKKMKNNEKIIQKNNWKLIQNNEKNEK